MSYKRANCNKECGQYGTSCRLVFDSIVAIRNMRIVERGGKLSVYAFATEELQRLQEKREFMERLGIQSTADIACKRLGDVGQRHAELKALAVAVLERHFPVQHIAPIEEFHYER